MELFLKTERLYKEYRDRYNEVTSAMSTLEKEEVNLFPNNELNDLRDKYKLFISNAFKNEYEKLLKENTFFWGCSFQVYKDAYREIMAEYLKEFSDALEIDFIRYEAELLINYIRKRYFGFIGSDSQIKINYSKDRKEEYLTQKAVNLGYDLQFYFDEDALQPSFNLIEMINNDNESSISVNWNGTQTEFIELIKALIENKTLKGKQKDIIEHASRFFNIVINNPSKTITDIQKRKNGNETLFINKLKTSLLDFINREIER